MKAVFSNRTGNQIVKVRQINGSLQSTSTSISLRNQVMEIRSIEDLPDVNEVSAVDGAVLTYNANTDKYDVAPITIDGGTF